MQADTSVGLRRGRRGRVQFRILVSEHQNGISDPHLGVHHLSLGPETKTHHLGAKGAMVKVRRCLGVAHDNMWGQCVKALGNWRNGTTHESAPLRKILS